MSWAEGRSTLQIVYWRVFGADVALYDLRRPGYVSSMVAIESHKPHNISWVDLAASDLAGASKFYEGLFGWTTFNDGQTPYSIFMLGDAAVAGAMQLGPEMGGMPPVWSTYVTVENADTTIGSVTDAGGSVMQPPFDVPGGGRIAVIADPSGAVICLFEGNGENGMKVMDENGAPCWFDCVTRDVDASGAFYTKVFGWTTEHIAEMEYTVFVNDGEWICGMMAMPPQAPAEVPAHWMVNFVVPDCDAAAVYATENGGTVTMQPMDTPFGRAAGILDPWGAVLSVIDRSTAVEG